MAQIEVKLVRSLIGSSKSQVATARALGLRKIGDASLQPDNPASRGKIRKISHLLETKPVEQGGEN